MRKRIPPLAALVLLIAACGDSAPEHHLPPRDIPPDSPLRNPAADAWSEPAPPIYRVEFETSRGKALIEVKREWSPRGADRFHQLVRFGFFDGARFFRVADGFVAQFGLSGSPEVDAALARHTIPDEPVRGSNRRGTLSFAVSGPNTRSTQLFVNLKHNGFSLDEKFPPIGEVIDGMKVFDQLYAGYGKDLDQKAIATGGQRYLNENYPKLDYIVRARIVEPEEAKAEETESEEGGDGPAKAR